MSRPRVVVLDEELPRPANTGKRIRTSNLLQRLAGSFDIELIVHESESDRCTPEIENLGISVRIAPGRIPSKSGALFAIRLAHSLWSRDPYSVTSHRSKSYEIAVRASIAERRPDLIHAEWTPYAQFWRPGDPPLVVAAHNVECEVLERTSRAHPSLAHRMFFRLQADRMERFERRVFSAAGHATAVSDRDAAKLRSWGCVDVEVVPNGVDTSYFAPRPEEERESRTLVFTGSMDWGPNQDAIAWFARAVHPHLIRKGSYRLLVVGRNPPRDFCRRANLPAEIVLTGTVDDVRPFLAKSAVSITPLRIGGGSRLKILEAMSMGLPVVSTTVGAEGLDLVSGHELLVADDGEMFAGEIERLLGTPEMARRLAATGRRKVTEKHDWDHLYLRQAAVWRRALE